MVAFKQIILSSQHNWIRGEKNIFSNQIITKLINFFTFHAGIRGSNLQHYMYGRSNRLPAYLRGAWGEKNNLMEFTIFLTQKNV